MSRGNIFVFILIVMAAVLIFILGIVAVTPPSSPKVTPEPEISIEEQMYVEGCVSGHVNLFAFLGYPEDLVKQNLSNIIDVCITLFEKAHPELSTNPPGSYNGVGESA